MLGSGLCLDASRRAEYSRQSRQYNPPPPTFYFHHQINTPSQATKSKYHLSTSEDRDQEREGMQGTSERVFVLVPSVFPYRPSPPEPKCTCPLLPRISPPINCHTGHLLLLPPPVLFLPPASRIGSLVSNATSLRHTVHRTLQMEQSIVSESEAKTPHSFVYSCLSGFRE